MGWDGRDVMGCDGMGDVCEGEKERKKKKKKKKKKKNFFFAQCPPQWWGWTAAPMEVKVKGDKGDDDDDIKIGQQKETEK